MISEGALKGYKLSLQEFTAQDNDQEPNYKDFEYTIDGANGMFVIDKNTGELTVNKTLDYETQVNYTFTVTATETGSTEKFNSSVTVTVELTNDNDNKPKFGNSTYEFTFQDTVVVGSVIGTVQATDLDAGVLGEITYELLSEVATFQINGTSGQITNLVELDFDTRPSYAFKVTARDGGADAFTKTLTDIADITVLLTDLNDNTPKYSNLPAVISITENQKVGFVYTVEASDSDSGDNANISFSIVSGNDNNNFTLDSVSGNLTLNGMLDYEAQSTFTLEIMATDKGTPPLNSTGILTINVEDENDNTPCFSSDRYNGTVSENSPVGFTVMQLTAKDEDGGVNGQINYLIISGNDDKLFYITSGYITTINYADRERNENFTLVVTATDGGSPPRSCNTTVFIQVEDINDELPVFDEVRYSVKINESLAVNSTVITVHADDKDIGENGRVNYEIVSGNTNDVFAIGADTGDITVASPLDWETNPFYSLDVKASDNGTSPKSSSTLVVIELLDSNDHAPVFRTVNPEFTIFENSPAESNVGLVYADDNDGKIPPNTNGIVSYAIEAGNTDGAFKIDSSGSIYTNITLDRETVDFYNITIVASDGGSPSLSTTNYVAIWVRDQNDNTPKFENATYSAEVQENIAAGYDVIQVNATDIDEGKNGDIVYSIPIGNTNSAFEILPNGTIRTKKELNREEFKSYTLTVFATDEGKPPLSSSVEVTITVLDSNDNTPTFINAPYQVTINEDTQSGTSIFKISANDFDYGSNGDVTYSIVSSEPESHFSVNSTTGEVTTNKALDRETIAAYTVNISASDAGDSPLASTTTLTVTVDDINDNAPVFDPQYYSASISEDTAVGTTFLHVNATDADAGVNGKISFIIVSGDEGRFRCHYQTGAVTVASNLDREYKSNFVMNITATDDGEGQSLLGWAIVNITLLDVNDNYPVFTKPSYLKKIDENIPVNTTVVQVIAEDLDDGLNGEVTLSIESGNAEGAFAIDPASGVITVTSVGLDRERTDSFTLEVVAKDAGDTSKNASTAVNIIVEDVNDMTPTFTQSSYAVIVSEMSVINTPIISVVAVDNDLGVNKQISYNIESGNSTGKFSIDSKTGTITIIGELDRENFNNYTLNISATDGGNPALVGYTSIVVYLEDVNDNSPEFTSLQYAGNVTENVGAGVEVVTVSATEKDSGPNGEIVYSIKYGDDGGHFKIDSKTGVITTTDFNIDREETNVYSLTVDASDNGVPPRSKQATVTINVMDVNDNAPAFSVPELTKSVSEGTNTGVVLFTLTAVDIDNGTNSIVQYNITAGNDEGIFTIDSTNGDVSLLKSLDRETQDAYSLTITATDQGDSALSSTLQLNITVTDVNDENPVFENIVIPEIMENATIGTVIVTLSATDKDTGINGQVNFKIVSGDTNQFFNLNKTTGALTNAKALDYEVTKTYELLIEAYDLGKPSLTAQKPFTIKVKNIDDNDPEFVTTTVTLSVGENLDAGAVVGSVNAVDNDDNVIYYYILSGNDGGEFHLNETSGLLKTLKSLDREVQAVYILVIQASSSQLNISGNGQSRRRRAIDDKTVQTVRIEIGDQNDNGPYFLKSEYTGGVSEDAQFGDNVLRIIALDDDSGNNSRIAYYILPEANNDKFTIDKESGWIKAAAIYSGKTGEEYQIKILAKDNFGVAPCSNTTVLVKIYVLTDEQRVMLTMSKHVDLVKLKEDKLIEALENITGYVINVDIIRHHVDANNQYDESKTDMLFHAVDPENNKIIDRDEVIKLIDKNYAKLEPIFTELGVDSVEPVVAARTEEGFNEIWAVLIALAILLFILLCIFIVIIYNMRRRQKRQLRAATVGGYGVSNHGMSQAMEMPGTNLHVYEGSNPIWVDPYDNWMHGKGDSASLHSKVNPKDIDDNPLYEAQEVQMDMFIEDQVDDDEGFDTLDASRINHDPSNTYFEQYNSDGSPPVTPWTHSSSIDKLFYNETTTPL